MTWKAWTWIALLGAALPSSALARPAPAAAKTQAQLPLRVAPGGHYLTTSDGRPFFWLGDTSWQLFHSATNEEADYYLTTRARQGYTVIQAVVLAELDGLTTPTPEGLKPFIDNDPTKPNAAYFDKVERIVRRAEELGLYMALLPSWGDKVTAPWGAGPRIFTLDRVDVARAYGRFLGQRLKKYNNIIWMLGGDRPPRVDENSYPGTREVAVKSGFGEKVDFTPIWTAMVQGLNEGHGKRLLFAYHTAGGSRGTANEMQDVKWLDINGRQSGHGGGQDVPIWENIAADYALGKPTIDLEPNYEDHPYNPWPKWNPATGYFDDYDVRKQTYRSVFAGGAGVTYGHHSIWQWAGARSAGVNHAKMDWATAMLRPGGRQMEFLRALIESRPMLSRIPDDSLVKSGQGGGGAHIGATRGQDGSYAFIYFPLSNQSATVDLTKLRGNLVAWWYDPRTGIGQKIGSVSGSELAIKSPPNGPDWVLIIDDADRNFPPPGLPR